MLGNKKVMGLNIQRHLDEIGISRRDFAKAIGVPYSSLTDWINGRTYPRIDKIEKMAQYFGVQKSDLVESQTDSNTVYYTDPETARLAQEMFEDPEMRALFHMKRNMEPEKFRAHYDMMKSLYKLEHPEDDDY